MSPDPTVAQPFNTQGLNQYAYVTDNPLSFVDPLGLCMQTSTGLCISQPGVQLPDMTVTPFVSFGGGGAGGGGAAATQPEGDPPWLQSLLDRLEKALQKEAKRESQCLGIALAAAVIHEPGNTPNSVLIQGLNGSALLSGGSRNLRENNPIALEKGTPGVGEIGTFTALGSTQIIFATPTEGFTAAQNRISRLGGNTVTGAIAVLQGSKAPDLASLQSEAQALLGGNPDVSNLTQSQLGRKGSNLV